MNTDFEASTWVAERLPDAADPDAIVTDRARLALIEHIAAAPPPRRWRRRLALRLAAVATLTVTVGVLVVGHRPLRPRATTAPRVAIARHGGDTGVHAARGGQTAPGSQPAGRDHTVLVRLAGDITQAPAPPGNATLVFRRSTFPDRSGFSGYDLYEDDGVYFYGATIAELRQALADPSSGDRELGGVLGAAARAAKLSPTAAASTMYRASPAPSSVSSYELGLRTALQKLATVKASPTLIESLRARLTAVTHATPAAARRLASPDQATIDNYLWMNCENALEGGGGQAAIRAGAMLAVSTLPDVHIQQTTLDGRSVVKITNDQFSDHYAETLYLDARTGVLVHLSGGTVGKPDSVDIAYTVTRVTAPGLDPAH
jgi:hypothetical protein